jgi:hypothetical protein
MYAKATVNAIIAPSLASTLRESTVSIKRFGKRELRIRYA